MQTKKIAGNRAIRATIFLRIGKAFAEAQGIRLENVGWGRKAVMNATTTEK